MSNDSEKNGKGVKLISFVTRRLVEGRKQEFIKAMNKHFNVVISTKNGQDTHVNIRGSEDNVRSASDFLRLLDQKAELFANERNLVRTGDIHDKEWGHMRVELHAALKKTKPVLSVSAKAAHHNSSKTQEAHLAEVFEDASMAQQVQKETRPEIRRGKTASGFYPRHMSQAIAASALKDDDVSVVFLEGPAGCGKTHQAMSYAIDMHNSPEFTEILLFRPRTVTGKEKMGAMPGGPEEKMDFYTQPFAKKVKEITGKPISNFKKMQRLTPDGERGASYVGALIIVDEAQNLSIDEAKMLITRMGQGAKVIICGDISSNQNDIGEDKISGLAHLIAHQASKFNAGDARLKKGMAFISFTEEDTSARHALMPSIINAYNAPEPELKDLLDKVTLFRKNAELIQAVESVAEYARKALKTAAGATFERFAPEAKSAFPSVFGLDNVHRLPAIAAQPA